MQERRDYGKWGWLLVFLLAAFSGYQYYVHGWDLARIKDEAFRLVRLSPAEPGAGEDGEPRKGTRWETRRPMLTARSEIGAAHINGKIYVVGGIDAYGRALRSMEVYDIASDAWSNGPSLPQALHHPAVATDGERLYVIGGFFGTVKFTPVDTAYVFDPAANRWSELGRLENFRGAAAAAVAGGKLLVFGGADLAGQTASLEIYDAERGRWFAGPSVPTVREHLAAAVAGETVYALGGRTSFPDGNAASAEAYDPGAGKWTRLKPMMKARSGFGAASVSGRVYVFGGEEREGTIAPVEVYVPQFGTWQPFGEMPTPRHGLAAVAVGNKIFVLGGGRRPGFSVSDLNEVLIIE